MELNGKSIALCVTGSVAIIEAPNLAIQLRKQHGAKIQCFMTENAVEYALSPQIMEWATKNTVVRKLTGSTEHMIDFDLVIVYPATFNTINKIANGIADNAVTSLCGATPANRLLIVPTMNLKYYNNPILKENLAKLKKFKIAVLGPKIEAGTIKVTLVEEIIDYVRQILSPSGT